MVIGYVLVNFIMIEGKDEIVIVDVMESYEIGLVIMFVFWNIIKKLVVVIVYIYNYVDYIYGVKVI